LTDAWGSGVCVGKHAACHLIFYPNILDALTFQSLDKYYLKGIILLIFEVLWKVSNIPGKEL
jgi:hypothetical protein